MCSIYFTKVGGEQEQTKNQQQIKQGHAKQHHTCVSLLKWNFMQGLISRSDEVLYKYSYFYFFFLDKNILRFFFNLGVKVTLQTYIYLCLVADTICFYLVVQC